MATPYKRSWPAGKVPAGSRKASGKKVGESWGVRWKDQDGKVHRKSGFRTKEDALAYGNERERQVSAGTYRKLGDKVTVLQCAQEYLQNLTLRMERETISVGHYENRRGHLQNYIVSEQMVARGKKGAAGVHFDSGWKGRKIASMRKVHVLTLRDQLLGTELKTATIRAALGTVVDFFDFAVSREYLSENPASDIPIETPRGERTKRRYPPSQASFQTVLGLADGDLRLRIELTAATGIREGELRALKNRSFDFDARTLHISQAVGRRYKVGDPKSESGIRTIPLNLRIAEKMKQYIQSRGAQPDALTFSHGDGGHLGPGSCLASMDRLIRDLAWPRQVGECPPGHLQRFTWHGLRHYAISTWIASALAPKAVQTFAGHATITMTFDRYGHLFPDEGHWEKIEAASALIYAQV